MASTSLSTADGYLDAHGRTDAELYLTDIHDGRIVASREMRLLADAMLPRFRDGYKRWHFDVEKALKPVRFIERYTCFPEGEKQGLPFRLERFQRSALELSFGFVDDDGYRQFRQTLMMVARKCGKSSFLAALMLYFLVGDNEPGSEVLCIANTEKQANRIFGHADLMRRKSPALAKRIRRGKVPKTGQSGLNYDANGSMLVSIPSNVGSADGYSASAYVYDELAATTDNGAMLMAIEESCAGRRQSSGWLISSENYVRHNIWDDKVDHGVDVLEGNVVDDAYLPIIYRLDVGDMFYEKDKWEKANPGLSCGIKSMTYMETRLAQAMQSPRVKSSFLTKDLCKRATSYTSYLTQEECHNPETFEIDPKTDRYCTVGFDLSDSGDLTAACARFMRPGDDRIYEITHAWIPESAVEINKAGDTKQRDGVPYDVWASGDHPWMTIVQGDRVDPHQAILGFIDELAEMGLYTRWIGYDKWHVDQYLRREMEYRVGEQNCIVVPYSSRVLSPLMKDHRLDLRAHRIVNPSPVAEWCRSCVMSKEDAAGNDYPNKKELRRNNRIDMYMAELYAMKVMVDNIDSYKQLIGWDR